MPDEKGGSPQSARGEVGASPSGARGSYSSPSVEPLDTRAAVRRRPGMYVGDVHDGTGLEHMVWEIVANALDQHLAGYARNVSVSIEPDGVVEVVDDGAGIPLHEVEVPEVARRTYLEDVLQRSHDTPTRDHHVPHVHLTTDLHGVGMLPVAALSSRLEIDTVWRGRRARLSLVRGEITSPITIEPTSRASGTCVRFLPDCSVFGDAIVSRENVAARLREIAWLVPHLELRFCGEVLPGRGGLFELVRSWGATEPILATRREIENATVDLAIGWAPDAQTRIGSFVNYLSSKRGTHVAGLFEGLADLAEARDHAFDAGQTRARLAPGLRAVVHVGLLDPSFGGPTRAHLLSPLASVVTRRAIVEAHDAPARRWQPAGAPPPSSAFSQALLRRLT